MGTRVPYDDEDRDEILDDDLVEEDLDDDPDADPDMQQHGDTPSEEE